MSNKSDDPIYTAVKWGRVSNTDIGNDIRKLSIVDVNTLKLSITLIYRFVSYFIVIIGFMLITLGFDSFGFYTTNPDFNFIFHIFGYLVVLVGIPNIYRSRVPIVFDRNESTVFKFGIRKNMCVRFTDIHALQIVLVSPSDARDWYELNIVLKSRERLFLQSYYKKRNVLRDAEQIAQFVNVKLWHKLTS